MIISIAAGTGQGPTEMAAFDAALGDAGVDDYNLIELSSVIPPGSVVERRRHTPAGDEFGRRLYIVMARESTAEAGTTAAAGLGWAVRRDDGRGFFVECHGASEDDVREDIASTLGAMLSRRTGDYGPPQSEVTSRTCSDQPVCALVVAVYLAVPWA